MQVILLGLIGYDSSMQLSEHRLAQEFVCGVN